MSNERSAKGSYRPVSGSVGTSVTPMTAGFHSTGGRNGAGVAPTTRRAMANDSRGNAKHNTGTSRAMMPWTSANSARRRHASDPGDTAAVSRPIQPSHGDAD